VIVVNKWDLAAEQEALPLPLRPAGRRPGPMKKPQSFQAEYLSAIRKELFFLDWAPVLFASAKTGQRVPDLFRQIGVVEHEATRSIGTPELNQTLMRALQSYSPPVVHGQRFKVYYAFQKPGVPPTLVLFVNNAGSLTPHYRRFLVDKIRSVWGFGGWPVLLECRTRERRAFVKKKRAEP
jgi:GTP-binding protein